MALSKFDSIAWQRANNVYQGDIRPSLARSSSIFASPPTAKFTDQKCNAVKDCQFIACYESKRNHFHYCFQHYQTRKIATNEDILIIPSIQCVCKDYEGRQCLNHSYYGIIDFKREMVVPLFCPKHLQIGTNVFGGQNVILLTGHLCLAWNFKEFRPCSQKATFCNPSDGHRLYCSDHAPNFFYRTKHTLCSEPHCDVTASFGPPTELKPLVHCRSHKLVSEICHVFGRKCDGAMNCSSPLTHGYLTDGIRRRCFLHADSDMQRMQQSNLCITCGIRASFGLPDTSSCLYCSGCNPNRSIYVRLYGYDCIHEDCNKNASFAYPTDGVKNYCAEHYPVPRETKTSKLCIHCKVEKAYFNLPEERIPFYCENCLAIIRQTDERDYVNVRGVVCRVPNMICAKPCIFARKGTEPVIFKEYCKDHCPNPDDYYNANQRRCMYTDPEDGTRPCYKRSTYGFSGHPFSRCGPHQVVNDLTVAFGPMTNIDSVPRVGNKRKAGSPIMCLTCGKVQVDIDSYPNVYCSSSCRPANWSQLFIL